MAILEPAAEKGLVVDAAGTGESAHEALQRKVFKELFEKTALKDLTVTPALAALFEEEAGDMEPQSGRAKVSLGRLVDALAFSLVQDVETKQRLLEAVDPAARGELLLRELVALATRLGIATTTGQGEGGMGWPPTLGRN